MTAGLFDTQTEEEYAQQYDWSCNHAPEYMQRFESEYSVAKSFIAAALKLPKQERDQIYEAVFCTPAELQQNISKTSNKFDDQRNKFSELQLKFVRKYVKLPLRTQDILCAIVGR